MPSNFQDVVSLSQVGQGSISLLFKMPELQIGSTLQSTVTLALANSAGTLALVAAPTGNGTVNFPTSGGTLLTNIDISAGTTSSRVSAWTYANANNVSFGFDGSNITATATVASSQASINLSAGTTSALASAFTFSNSNGVSFGLNGSTLTGSVATSLTNINVSAGTTSNNLSAVVFSNSNGVSFGLNGSTVTGSVATSLTNINLSAGTTSNNLSAAVFSNSNNVSFGLSGSTVTATATIASSLVAPGNLSSFQPFFPAAPNTAFGVVSNSISLQPILIDQNLTVTNLMFMSSNSNNTATQSITINAALYTVKTTTGGVSNWSLSSASSQSFSYTITGSGGFYRSMTVASWNMTPGLYVFGLAITNTVAASMIGGSTGTINIKNGAELQSFILTGVYNSGGIVASIGVSDTASYVRSGSVLAPPWVLFMGS